MLCRDVQGAGGLGRGKCRQTRPVAQNANGEAVR